MDNNSFSVGTYFRWQIHNDINNTLISNIIIDGSFAYGHADYDLQDQIASGSFDADRYYYNLNLTGIFKFSIFGLPVRSHPRIGVRYVSETQHAFEDSNGLSIASRENSIGQIFYGSEMYIALSQNIEAYLQAETAWDFKKADKLLLTDGSIFKRDEISSLIGAGIQFSPAEGLSLRLEGIIDNIGRNNFETYSGIGKLNLSF